MKVQATFQPCPKICTSVKTISTRNPDLPQQKSLVFWRVVVSIIWCGLSSTIRTIWFKQSSNSWIGAQKNWSVTVGDVLKVGNIRNHLSSMQTLVASIWMSVDFVFANYSLYEDPFCRWILVSWHVKSRYLSNRVGRVAQCREIIRYLDPLLIFLHWISNMSNLRNHESMRFMSILHEQAAADTSLPLVVATSVFFSQDTIVHVQKVAIFCAQIFLYLWKIVFCM